MKVRIAEIIVDPTIQIRRSNHEQTIRRYEESFDKLPPVDVFDTPEGRVLADGFHRLAAGERLGHTEIEANVHAGSRVDALEFAVIANTKNADPLTPEERDIGIRRLRQLHPERSFRDIAEAMSVSHMAVKRVFERDEVRREVVTPVTRVTESHYDEVASADRKNWEPLIKAADERGWSRDETRQAVRNLRDERVPEEHKQAILEGRADPLIVTDSGELGVSFDRVGRVMREATEGDAQLALQKVLGAVANLRAVFGAKQMVETMPADRRRQVAQDLRTVYIPFLEGIAEAAEDRKLEAVK